MIEVELKDGRKLKFYCACDGIDWRHPSKQKLVEEFAVVDKQMEDYRCPCCNMYPWNNGMYPWDEVSNESA